MHAHPATPSEHDDAAALQSPEVQATFSPYVQRADSVNVMPVQQAVKSYRNDAFLGSYDGRLVRIICEFEEPKQRLRHHYIRSTVLFFGSARSMNRTQYDATLARLRARRDAATDAATQAALDDDVARLRLTEWMCPWVDVAEELARRLAQFAQHNREIIQRSFEYMPDYFGLRAPDDNESMKDYREQCHDLVVTTGGGPGFMEAANKGAASVPGARTIGMGISLPFEQGLNQYVTHGLAFTFHYFFTRKYWMMYSCRAIVVAPGGFGTLDETFELLTLRQTRKIPNLPIVLLGKTFWQTVINWQALANYGVVSQSEVDSLCFTDSVDEALQHIQQFYVNLTKALQHDATTAATKAAVQPTR